MSALVLGYSICSVAFLSAAVAGGLSRLDRAYRILLVLGCVSTAIWAGAQAVSAELPTISFVVPGLEFLRGFAWIIFVAFILNVGTLPRKNSWISGPAVAVTCLGLAAGAILLLWVDAPIAAPVVYLQLLFSVAVLLSLENLYRNADVDSRWAIKGICFALGVLFGYDFYLYADAALTLSFDPTLAAMRGYVDTLAVPFLILAMRRGVGWQRDPRVSRAFVFHSAVLLGCGFYLLAMSLTGTLLRSIGGGWGPILQGVFLVVAVLIMLTAFSSASFRSSLRMIVSKNFYRHKYDYRTVWLKFIQQISRDEGAENLHKRTLHAVADILDSPAGALWALQPEDAAYIPTAVWSFGARLPVLSADHGLPRFLTEHGAIINLAEFKRDRGAYGGLVLPEWLLDHPRGWIVIPLIHHQHLEAFIVLGRPRVGGVLGWEEVDLLKTVGAQAASYLAEERTSRALVDAQRLDHFNQRFAFVIHDIKNVVSQMTLMTENAVRHGDNPNFQRDLLSTVGSSVARMKKMLVQLAEDRRREDTIDGPIDIVPLLLRTCERWNQGCENVVSDGLSGTMMAIAGEDKLMSVLDHLIQNAIDAAAGTGTRGVELALRKDGTDVLIEVRDHGVGMDPDFVRDRLFRPLDSWKSEGMGLGAFQARQLVRSMGGRLEVDSRRGAGTTMRVRLRMVIDFTSGMVKQEGFA